MSGVAGSGTQVRIVTMCEECENPAAPHLSYNEKRKRISATWQPARKAGRQFIAKPADPAPRRETDADGRD